MKGLYNWVKNNNIQTPVKLEIHIDKIDNRNGYNTRYMKVMIDGLDVSQMVAEATGLKTSIARNTYGDIIVNGVGMDMCFALQSRLYKHAYQDGYPDMFDRDMYVYIDNVQKHKEQCATRRENEKLTDDEHDELIEDEERDL